MSRRIICDNNTCRIVIDNCDSDKNFKVSSNGWVIYGAGWCGFCRKSYQLLDNINVDYCYYDIDKLTESEKQQLVKITNGYTSIPKIFYNGEFIGGYTELKNIFG